MANWSELPRDLLFAIAKCLQSYFDFLHFRYVCTTWRASVPFDLLPRPSFCSRRFLRRNRKGNASFVSKRSACLFKFPAGHSRSQVTPRFWLVMLRDDYLGKMRFFDPLYDNNQPIPVQYPLMLDISTFHVQELGSSLYEEKYDDVWRGGCTCTVARVAGYMNVNARDDDNPLVVMKIGKIIGCLAYIKNGEEEYTKIEVEGFEVCEDLIHFEHKFYAVDDNGTTVCVDPFSGVSSLMAKASPDESWSYYFVVLSGNLLLAEITGGTIQTFRFKLFQLDEERKRWDRLESLGNGILFLREGVKFSAPEISGVEGNCIVFYVGPVNDEGEDGKISEVDKAFVYHLRSGMTVPLEACPDLLQLFCPPSFG